MAASHSACSGASSSGTSIFAMSSISARRTSISDPSTSVWRLAMNGHLHFGEFRPLRQLALSGEIL